METIFNNTENSKTNKSHKFRPSLANKLNRKNSRKNMALVTARGKISNLHVTTIDLRYPLRHGMMNLIYLMNHILLLKRVILSILLRIIKL